MFIAKHILSILLILNLFIGSVGIDIYRHICGTTGISIVSAFFERHCSVLEGHSCCDSEPKGTKDLNKIASCCDEENTGECDFTEHYKVFENCCTNIVENIKINLIANFERNHQIYFILPFRIDFNIKPIFNLINPFYRVYHLLINTEIISSGAIATKYIHHISKFNSSDTEIPLS